MDLNKSSFWKSNYTIISVVILIFVIGFSVANAPLYYDIKIKTDTDNIINNLKSLQDNPLSLRGTYGQIVNYKNNVSEYSNSKNNLTLGLWIFVSILFIIGICLLIYSIYVWKKQ